MIVTALLAAASFQMIGPARIAPGDVCPAYKATPAIAEPLRRGPQTLKSLPPANQELTVERRVAGCAVPTIVRENIQGDGRFSRAR